MGGSFYVIYIGRDLTSEEEDAFEATFENKEQPELGYKESEYQIDGFNVAHDDVFETYVVCQFYIGTLSTEDVDEKLHEGIDYTKLPKPHDDRYKLRFRYDA